MHATNTTATVPPVANSAGDEPARSPFGATIAPAPFVPGEQFTVRLPFARVEKLYGDSHTLRDGGWMALPAGYAARMLVAGEKLRLTDCLLTGNSRSVQLLFCAWGEGKIIGETPDFNDRIIGDSQLFFRLTRCGRDCDEAELLALLAANYETERLREIEWIRAASCAYSDALDAGQTREDVPELVHEVTRRMNEAKLQGAMTWDEITGVMQIFHPDSQVDLSDDSP